jgi:hypothetical protein
VTLNTEGDVKLAQGEYYKLNPEVELKDLVNFNLFRKLSDSGGRSAFVQFHRKNAPFGSCVPSQIYVHPEDIEALLKAIPGAKIFQKKLPCGKIAFMLMTSWYEKKVLDNPALDLRATIELTVHCLNESLRFLQANVLSANDLNDSLRKISSNLSVFTNKLLCSAEAREYLLDEIFQRNKNNLPHALRVCMYTCDTLAVISNENSINFEPELVTGTIWGTLIHDQRFWSNLPAEQLEKAKANWPAAVADLYEHLNVACETKYGACSLVAPILRIVTITDAFDELTARNHSTYVFNPADAFSYLKQQMADKSYRHYLDIFIRTFQCSTLGASALQVG